MIPLSSAFVERIVSAMTSSWTDDKSRMRVELVEAELIVKVNVQMTCAEYHNLVDLREQRPLLKFSIEKTKYKSRYCPFFASSHRFRDIHISNS